MRWNRQKQNSITIGIYKLNISLFDDRQCVNACLSTAYLYSPNNVTIALNNIWGFGQECVHAYWKSIKISMKNQFCAQAMALIFTFDFDFGFRFGSDSVWNKFYLLQFSTSLFVHSKQWLLPGSERYRIKTYLKWKAKESPFTRIEKRNLKALLSTFIFNGDKLLPDFLAKQNNWAGREEEKKNNLQQYSISTSRKKRWKFKRIRNVQIVSNIGISIQALFSERASNH